MRWLVGSYQLTDAIPPCWGRHDAIAEELAGLYVAWQAAWADKNRADGALGWHEQLHRALDGRLAKWLRGARCGDACALDHDYVDDALTRWARAAGDASADDYRLTRVRRFAPPIPQPRPTRPPGTTKQSSTRR